jgi:hypothetical protein
MDRQDCDVCIGQSAYSRGTWLVHQTSSCDDCELLANTVCMIDVHQMCVLRSDMTGLPLSSFELKKVGDKSFFHKRKKYYHCNFDIHMKIGLTDLEFEMWYKGKVRNELLKVAWSDAEPK